MALRLWVTACKPKRIEKSFGSKDKKLLKHLLEFADEHLGDDDDRADALAKTRELLTRLVNEGNTKQAGPESTAEVAAAYALARVQSAGPWPDGEDELEWSGADVRQLVEQCGARLGPVTDLLDSLLTGRNLFGEGFDEDAGWYAFLRTEEIAQLASKMQLVFDECLKIVDSRAMNQQDFDSNVVDIMEYLLEGLTSAQESRLEMFVYAS